MTDASNLTGKGARRRWVNTAVEAFEASLLAEDYTDIDKLIMRGQYSRVKQGLSVSFADSDAPEIKAIRSARLKILGYRWNPADRSWGMPLN